MTIRAAGALALALAGLTTAGSFADTKPDYPPFADISKGFEKVISTADGKASLYNVWVNKKTDQMLAELPRGYSSQKHFFAMTVSKGEQWAGLQHQDMYLYWKRYDKRIALVMPELGTLSSGDQESKSAVSRHFTDRVITDVPILCMGPSGQPVIDMDALLAGKIGTFFGSKARGANARLSEVKVAKAFPQNIELEFEMPVAGGQLRTFHYSISKLPDKTGYKPRVADERVGYFTTSHRDLGKYQNEEKWIRYINRWHLEKADSKLKMSPPKEPIVFYVEHTVPVRYRRFVRDGIEYWNKAFENVGIVGAIEVRQQDKNTGAHMDKDPEDVRYNFMRWLSNDISTAIGPSRVHPKTGQILDADVVLTDGWIRVFDMQYHKMMPDIAMQGFSPETLAWLDENPTWDPRIRMADPAQREFLLDAQTARGPQAYGGHVAANVDPEILGDDEMDGIIGRNIQMNGMCRCSHGKAMDMAMLRMHLEMVDLSEITRDDDGNGTDDSDLIDGVPDWFVGPLLADLVAHEVGHTLGLRHNFKASSIYTLAEINSEELKGKTPFTGSVMDYNPLNINMDGGEVQGDYAMIDIGPYDMWAIEYGYSFGNHKDVLKRVAEPELVYATDEDTWGPDPYARRYDFSKNPIDFAENQMRLVKRYRGDLLDRFVKDGQSWSRARKGYQLTLAEQTKMLSMMGNWLGGAHVNRDRKGDPNARPPIQVVDAKQQRQAMQFLIDNALDDDAYGLNTEMLQYLTVDKWSDGGGMGSMFSSPAWEVHDRVIGIQAAALTMMMNPGTLRQILDNEFRIDSNEDAITVAEVMDNVTDAVFAELDTKINGATFTNRQPMISSLRRNLQSEAADRLIDLTLQSRGMPRTIRTLAQYHLKRINGKLETILEKSEPGGQVDQYTYVHLEDMNERIERALNSVQIVN